jgi:hypothetical protein
MNLHMNLDTLIGLLILVPVLVLSMMAHELAHAFVAHRLGDPTAKRMGRLSFNPLKHMDPMGTAMFFITYLFSSGGFVFGWAKPVPVSPYYFKSRQWGMALVSLAGPITNFALAIVSVVVLNAIHKVLRRQYCARTLQPDTYPAFGRLKSVRRLFAEARLRAVGGHGSVRHDPSGSVLVCAVGSLPASPRVGHQRSGRRLSHQLSVTHGLRVYECRG